jgi:kinesin family protein 18/19
LYRYTQDKDYTVECSYTEVYNELVFDLLIPNSSALELREDPERGPMVAGLTHVKVEDETQIFSLLRQGNARRKTEETGANAVSSRSHAVLEIWVTRSERNHYNKAFSTGKLALVDLAGAERASETNNRGQQLRDGANINKSLLSLANCINALGKRKKKGFVFVPFRDSKLTRILKDGLCGNSRTVMVATVSGSSLQYEHTVNTLKYANRAKEIKTHVRENQGTVETHIAEYQRMIDALQEERRDLQAEVKRLKSQPGSQAGSRSGSGLLGMPPPMPAEEVAKFAFDLGEAVDACARAQRVLLGAKSEAASRIVNYLDHTGDDNDGEGGGGEGGGKLMIEDAPEVDRATEEVAAAAEALEALAPMLSDYNGGSSSARNTGGSNVVDGSGEGGGAIVLSASGGADAREPLPVSAADLAALHARAALAIAADYDAAAMDVRDVLISDQRRVIQCLMAALETRASLTEKDCALPENCSVGQLDARWRTLSGANPGGGTGDRSKEAAEDVEGGGGGSGRLGEGGGSQGAAVVPLGAIRIEAEALAARAKAAAAAIEAREREEAAMVAAQVGPSTPEQAKQRKSHNLDLDVSLEAEASESWSPRGGRLTPPPLTPVREQRTGELSLEEAGEGEGLQAEKSGASGGGASGGGGGGNVSSRSNSAGGNGRAKSAKSSAAAAAAGAGAGAAKGSVKPSPYAAASAATRLKGSALARRLSRVASNKSKKADGDVSDTVSEASEV